MSFRPPRGGGGGHRGGGGGGHRGGGGGGGGFRGGGPRGGGRHDPGRYEPEPPYSENNGGQFNHAPPPHFNDRGDRGGGPSYGRDRGREDRGGDYGQHWDRGDGPGRGGGRGGRGGGRQHHRRGEREDANGRTFELPVPVRDAPSEQTRLERLARERVSRTLFIRNVAYETDSNEFRRRFEQFGEVSDWFDAIRNRGLVFVTFYDIRAAEVARQGMTGTKLFERPIDVHYSLPKEKDQDGPCDASKHQGSLLVTLHPRHPLEEADIGNAAAQFGEVKAVKQTGYQEQKVVEYYDSRAAVDFQRTMDGKPFKGGDLEVRFVWDVGDVVNPDPVAAEREYGSSSDSGASRGRNRRDSRGGHAGPGRFNRRDERDRRDEPRYDDRREREREPRFDDYRDRYEDRRSSTGHYDEPRRDYARQESRYNDAPPPAPAPPSRLDEARKVQNLLTSLGNAASLANKPPPPPPPPAPAPAYPPQGYAPPPPAPYPPAQYAPPPPAPAAPAPYPGYPPAPPPPAPAPYPPPATHYPPPPAPTYPPAPPPAPAHNPYAAPPPAPYPPPPAPYAQHQSPPPPPAPYSAPPRPAYPPASSPPAPSSSSLPPNVLALLQNPPRPSGVPPPPLPQGYQHHPYPPPQGHYPPPPQHQQHQRPADQGYDPARPKDVDSLLAMLKR